MYTSDLQPPSAPVQVMSYADDIIITSTHTQAPRNIYNHTYKKSVCLDKTKQSHTKSRQNNLHSVHARPCRIYEQSGPINTQQCTTHGNAPKCFGCKVVVVYPLPWPLLVGGVRCSRLWSTSQLLRPSGQQCSHSGGVCPQIQGRQWGAYVGAVEEMMCVVCVDVTEGA